MDEPEGGDAPAPAGAGAEAHFEPGEVQPPAEPAEHLEQAEEPSSHQALKTISSIRRMSLSDGEPFEIDKAALEGILDVSSRLTDIQMRSRVSMSALTQGHETYKDKQVNKRNN